MNEYMKVAFSEAINAYENGNVPVGAVIVKNDSILTRAHNMKNSSNVSIYHAEILAIINACKLLNSWHLDDSVMYVTLKPCRMCEAAIAESRIKKVVYLLDSNYSDNLNGNISGICYEKIEDDLDYANLISNFFKDLR